MISGLQPSLLLVDASDKVILGDLKTFCDFCVFFEVQGKLTKSILLFCLQIAVKICQTTVLCRQFLALMSLSEFCREKLSFVAISFYAMSLLFGSCRLSEFTLAGPL